jgi:hypothetical protein
MSVTEWINELELVTSPAGEKERHQQDFFTSDSSVRRYASGVIPR